MPNCSVENCHYPIRARGWCSTHYGTARRRGVGLRIKGSPRVLTNVEPMPPPMTSDARYWKHVPRPGEGCWLWQGVVLPTGYGQWINRYAHVISYMQVFGPIPRGMQIDHLCHNRDLTCRGGTTCLHRRCVRLDHLEAVSPSENLRRSW